MQFVTCIHHELHNVASSQIRVMRYCPKHVNLLDAPVGRFEGMTTCTGNVRLSRVKEACSDSRSVGVPDSGGCSEKSKLKCARAAACSSFSWICGEVDSNR